MYAERAAEEPARPAFSATGSARNLNTEAHYNNHII